MGAEEEEEGETRGGRIDVLELDVVFDTGISCVRDVSIWVFSGIK